MKLLLEESFDVEVITESNDNSSSKDYYIRGIYFQCNVQNGNKRFYPKENCTAAIEKFINEHVHTNRAVGELGHPDTGPKINLERVSHKILDLHWDGDNVMGNSLITNTPMGIVAKGLIDAQVQLGVSSRGAGSVRIKNGIAHVNGDLVVSTFDIVQNPSAPDAFVKGIMEEVEWFYENNEFVARAAEQAKSRLKKMAMKQINENKIQEFSKFLSELRNS